MTPHDLTNIFLAILTVLAFSVAVAAAYMAVILVNVKSSLEALLPEVRKLFSEIEGTLSSVKNLTNQSEKVVKNANEISSAVKAKVLPIIEQASDFYKPLGRIAALRKGFQAGLSFFVNRKDPKDSKS